MVGFDPHGRVKLSDRQYVLAGAFSGLLTRALCQPFDVVKVRFQLQIEPIKRLPNSKYYGIGQAFCAIIREERVHGLWKGHIPAQGLSVVFGLVQVYPTLPYAVSAMYRHEGVTCFWKGLVPTLMQVAPQTGFQFAFYSALITAWRVLFGHKRGAKIGGFQSLFCGSFAGIFAKAAVYPLDLVKKRLQVQGFEKARLQFGEVRRYNGMVHCLAMILREEGVAGWYKGLKASLLKSAISVGITFFSYEQACNFLHTYGATAR